MELVSKILGLVLLFVVILLIQPLIIYCLWDDVMVKFFSLQDVTFYDSIWISILFSVLFKNYTTSSKG
ncbi:hypothetical protein VPHG_00198 [Vibrio phage 11895-B1]|uniref:hypothetical protein n=1 Tax=Vibrio phage 11895-B1 TaxID=754075 RepID=UPI0002C1138B|nr:hypothetical protein VPHG_00198 [Vibrio phage 11895-B1]AGH32261.1 hypothetical protein VPHG_00198 [Vibrio phage 11895-B1]